jgi:hypothetical protein
VLTVHQLLGRIVYFHALFIEPAHQTEPAARVGRACCNHGTAPGHRTVDDLLQGTAWMVIEDVAATLPEHQQTCPEVGGACCATCTIVSAAATIAAGWVCTEYRAYHYALPDKSLLRCSSRAAAKRMGRVFAEHLEVNCPTLDRLTSVSIDEDSLPGPEELPLMGEFLALWTNPTVPNRPPVASWLNQCTGLHDVRRVLAARRSGL